jgi:hypothetical protein
MRALLLFEVLLAQFVAGSVLPLKPPVNFTSPDSFEVRSLGTSRYPRNGAPSSEEPHWGGVQYDALCRGDALLHAMTLSELDAAWALGWPHLQSPWDGDMKAELKTWGWHDSDENHNNADYFCNFEEDMGNLFKGLDVDGRSAQLGGPNHCFFLEHRNGPTVKKNPDGSLPAEVDQKYDAEGKEYRVSQTASTWFGH